MRMFKSAGAEAVYLNHGDTKVGRSCQVYKRISKMPNRRWFIVIPVRDPEVRKESCRRRFPTSPEFLDDEWQNHTRFVILTTAWKLKLPIRFVSYEALVQNPEGVKRDLLNWVELPNLPWPESVFDGNEKYRKEMLRA